MKYSDQLLLPLSLDQTRALCRRALEDLKWNVHEEDESVIKGVVLSERWAFRALFNLALQKLSSDAQAATEVTVALDAPEMKDDLLEVLPRPVAELFSAISALNRPTLWENYGGERKLTSGSSRPIGALSFGKLGSEESDLTASSRSLANNILLYFSYAEADDSEFLRKFYKDLDSEVRPLSGLPERGIGFLDRNKIASGATWAAVLEEGLRTCRVFVPLYSASYFDSPYCGKEFAVFRERLHNYQQQRGLPVDDTLIFPVLWQPEHSIVARLPPLLNKIQYTHGSYPKEYTSEGVFVMVRLSTTPSSKYYNEYWEFVRKLATAIANAVERFVLPALTAPLPPLANVTSLFSTTTQRLPSYSDEAGPRFVENLGELTPSKRDMSSKIDGGTVLANSSSTSKLSGASDSPNPDRVIFVSYRREDSPDIAGRIYDSLVQRFGPKAIFKDVDSIPLGVDFKRYLEKQVDQCSVMLAVIGKSWLKTRTGKRRLDNPIDFVRIELASALRREIPVIPLMVSNARMPSEADLPEDLRGLVFRNFIQIRPDPDFHNDMNRLIKELERPMDQNKNR